MLLRKVPLYRSLRLGLGNNVGSAHFWHDFRVRLFLFYLIGYYTIVKYTLLQPQHCIGGSLHDTANSPTFSCLYGIKLIILEQVESLWRVISRYQRPVNERTGGATNDVLLLLLSYTWLAAFCVRVYNNVTHYLCSSIKCLRLAHFCKVDSFCFLFLFVNSLLAIHVARKAKSKSGWRMRSEGVRACVSNSRRLR